MDRRLHENVVSHRPEEKALTMRAVALVAALLPAPAAAFLAQNGMTATQISPTEIAVDYHPRRDDVDYWCAAGDLLQRGLGAPGKTRLWRASPKPRRSGQGVLFTLDRAKKAEGAGLSDYGSGPRDGSISVAMAVGSYCRSQRIWRD